MRRPLKRCAALVGIATLAWAATASASIVGLPNTGPPTQVNSDLTAGIDPAQSAGFSDVTAGALTAGGLEVPWAAFEQKTPVAQQIFVRAFKGGVWNTEGASLNIDPTKEAENPGIDFAGAGRTVPWAAWYEPNTALGGLNQVFASRFTGPTGAPANVWIAEGQGRVVNTDPSLNINTNRDGEDPAVAGGTTTAGGTPAPWVAWQELDGAATNGASKFQVFVSKGVKLLVSGAACPAGTKPVGGNSVGLFCWQQTGIERLEKTTLHSTTPTDPTLNIDPTRDGIEPDIAFTGPGDTVPWVVWYEQNASGLSGLNGNEMVFAAKGTSSIVGDGAIQWTAVGNGTATSGGIGPQLLDVSGSAHVNQHFGGCAESATNEGACSLNRLSTNDAEDPQVAAGTLTPGTATVPWVVWDEKVGPGNTGHSAIFISHLVGGDHFALFNGGNPLSNPANDATRPDIQFVGNEPYVSWREQVGGQNRAFIGHFEGGASNPVWVLDTPNGEAVSSAGTQLDARVPIGSACFATPFNADGVTCQGGAVGTPFYLFTDGAPSAQKLFGQTYQPDALTTLAATDLQATSATANGSVNTAGSPVSVHFDFGPTGSYGSSSAPQPLAASENPAGFGASLSGVPGATIHYRAVAVSDFGTFVGADQTVTLLSAPVTTPPAKFTLSSRITSPHGTVKARKLTKITGTAKASLGLKFVEVAVVRTTGSVHASKVRRTCRALESDGKLHTIKVSKTHHTCVDSHFIRAKSTTKWTFTLKHRLSKGTYLAISRAVDKAGHVEHIGSGDKASFKVK